MDLLKSDGSIITCSSGTGSNSAISVIRLSGFKDIKFFSNYINIDSLKPRYAHFCQLLFKNNVIDEIIAIYYPAPNSFTGENILELNVHGNRLNVEKIINLFIKEEGFKSALPGEFTYRALKNNKLNLSQVEGLDLLLNANSDFILNQGFSLLSGSLQDEYLKLQKAYIKHLSSIEMSIDFMEDVGEENANKLLNDSHDELKNIIESLFKKINRQSTSLLKPDIVLFGDPNSGKSSLFNKLLSEDRSIITDIKGTTRDYISEDYRIKDVFFSLIDTAGIRKTSDKVEKFGVERSIDKVIKAFYKVLVINPLDYDENNLKTYLSYSPDCIVFTHEDKIQDSYIDLFKKIIGPIEPVQKSGPIGANKTSGPIEPNIQNGPIGADSCFLISTFNPSDNFFSNINDLVYIKYESIINNQPIVLDRHKEILFSLSDQFEEYSKLLKSESDISIISSELTSLGNCISELIGIVSPNDVLHNIFDNFCIGK